MSYFDGIVGYENFGGLCQMSAEGSAALDYEGISVLDPDPAEVGSTFSDGQLDAASNRREIEAGNYDYAYREGESQSSLSYVHIGSERTLVCKVTRLGQIPSSREIWAAEVCERILEIAQDLGA